MTNREIGEALKAWLPVDGESPGFFGLDRSAPVVTPTPRHRTWRERLRVWLIRKLGGDVE